MAESMDEGPSDPRPPLQQDLTCSVCRGIFSDPLVLPCTHSFCRECLRKSTRFNGEQCPLCREKFTTSQAIPNRVLSQVCQSFALYPPQGSVPGPGSEAACNLHLKPLLLYCEKDEQPLCVDCVALHNTHKLWPLTEAVSICKRELEFKVQILEWKVDSYKKLTESLDSTVESIRNQAQEAEQQIHQEFQRLHDALLTEERLRLEALAAEEAQKIAALQELSGTIRQDVAGLRKLVDSVKRETGNEDVPLLQNFQDLKRKAQWTLEDRRHPDDSLLNMGKHVGALSFKIWTSLQEHVKCSPVVFDPNTSSPWLSVSADLTTIKESPERLVTPDNPERFDPCVFVLGAEGYTSGKHRWDVIVGDSPSWIVGVCKESVARKKKFTLSPSRGVWCVGLSKGVCTAFTNERTALQVQQRPERIRVKLNMERGEVSFWDGESSNHLVTLTHHFNEKIFPFFGPGLHNTPMILAPAKITVHAS
ncbi:tripartite motif containing 35-28 isoform X1 [Takifugu rubripes]|uniref:Tripartite motif containing 35-28 n=1 Tax=Takifugu rubripes TaxID=31033 RepID=H2RW94_TAKRU|nr:zinc-binding protein A33-like isoform X1 [Takifugu rubripes]